MGREGKHYVAGADKTVTTRLPAATVDALDDLAHDLGMSRYEVIRRMIEATLIEGTHRSAPLQRRKYGRGRPDKTIMAALARAAKACASHDQSNGSHDQSGGGGSHDQSSGSGSHDQSGGG